MNDHSEEVSIQESVPLQPHHYPLWIKMFGCFAIAIFLYTCIRFIWIELPYHRMAHEVLIKARFAFNNHQYAESARLYQSLVEQYPNFKQGKIAIAKSYFALCEQDLSFDGDSMNVDYYYILGMNALGEEKYTKKEQRKLQDFLPQSYHENFESSFVEV